MAEEESVVDEMFDFGGAFDQVGCFPLLAGAVILSGIVFFILKATRVI